MVSREHGTRTGHVRKIDYDQAVIEGLGAQLDEVKNQYYLSLLGEEGRGIYVRPVGSDAPTEITRAFVIFKQSEPTGTEFDLPCVLVSCDDFSPVTSRIFGLSEAYRVPAPGAKPVGIGDSLGWSHYEVKPQEQPYDFTYTIECWSRYRMVAQILLQMVMAKYSMQGQITVYDTLGVDRVYHAYQEGTADLTEVNSMVDRICGYSVTIRIEGELTLDRTPITAPSFTGPTIPGGAGAAGAAGGAAGGGGVDPGPGGLIGDGLPTRRITLTGDEE